MSTVFRRTNSESSNVSTLSEATIMITEETPLLSSVNQEQHEWAAVAKTPDNRKPSGTNKISNADFWWIMSSSQITVFLGSLDGTVVATLLSPIGSHFNESQKASYLGTSYLLSVAAFTPLYGRLSDILGRKGAMTLALGLLTLGTALCAVAPTMNALILARAVAGMGGGGVMTVCTILMTDLVPLKNRGIWSGISHLIFAIGSGLGGPIGGWINDTVGWRWSFYFQVPIMVACIGIVLWKVNIPLPVAVREMTWLERVKQIDFLGAFTMIVAVTSLLLPISYKTAEDKPWSHPLVWAPLIISAGSFVAFGYSQAYWSSHPIMPWRIIKQRTPLFVSLASAFLLYSASALFYNLPMYFSAVRLTSATEAGLHLVPNSLASGVGSIFIGWIMRETGKYRTLLLICAAMPIYANISFSTWNEETSAFRLWFDVVPSGIGTIGTLTITQIAVIAAVSRADMAVSVAITYLFRTVAQVLGVSFSGALLQGVLLRDLRNKITGPDAEQIIQEIRHSSESIRYLKPEYRASAIQSYSNAIQLVFVMLSGMGIITFLCCLPIEEFPLPDTLASDEEEEDRSALIKPCSSPPARGEAV